MFESSDVGMGALYTYQNDDLRLRIVNDRGMLNGQISSLYDVENYKDIELFSLFLKRHILKQLNPWERKLAEKKIFSCEEECSFLENTYEEIVKSLNEENYHFTFKTLDSLGMERSRDLFS